MRYRRALVKIIAEEEEEEEAVLSAESERLKNSFGDNILLRINFMSFRVRRRPRCASNGAVPSSLWRLVIKGRAGGRPLFI